MPRRSFSGRTYLTFEQTEMAMKATWINEWLDEGLVVLGKTARDDPAEWLPVAEAVQPHVDSIGCRMADGTDRDIYGYRKEAAPPA